MDFMQSKTKENLMRAFVGECQARNRYTFAAGQAKKNKLPVIEAVFTFTAGQELAHAKIFYNHLACCAGQNLKVEGTYPIDAGDSLSGLLRAAQHNEAQEHDPVYRSFAQTAREEGFSAIADSFSEIAQIEKTHGERFEMFADLLEQDKLFVSESECGWMCLNCGHVLTGTAAPPVCPVCSHEQGYFIRLTMAPYGAK